LALNPCPRCRSCSPEAFDLFPLARRLQGGRRQPSTEEVLDLLNGICRSYATARWLLYKAVADRPTEKDHVITIQGYDSARHELPVGLLMSATSGFFSVLSQIAFAINSYYSLGHAPHRVNLETVWGLPGRRGLPQDRGALHPRLRRRSASAIAALYCLAQSFEHGLGRHTDLRGLRNSLEHHAVVAFDAPVDSLYYVAVGVGGLQAQAFQMGHLAKAAVWYFGGAVLHGERERLKRSLRRGQNVTAVTKGVVRRV
jgi:hypothetical protein